jgi:carbon storage regulator
MLVLTRKVGEEIVVDDNIRITVVSLGNGRVKIGVSAPKGIIVDRGEVHERKAAEGMALSEATPAPAMAETAGHNRLTGAFANTAAVARPELRKPR